RARRPTLEQPLVRLEAELRVQRVRVARVQHPAPVDEGPAFDDLPDELEPETAAAVLVEHVDVGEIDEAGRVAVDDAGKADLGAECTTFEGAIAKQAVAAEGRRARIAYHEQERNGFTNVYLDRVELLEEEGGDGDERVEEVAWRTAVDAAPWLLGEAPAGG